MLSPMGSNRGIGGGHTRLSVARGASNGEKVAFESFIKQKNLEVMLYKNKIEIQKGEIKKLQK